MSPNKLNKLAALLALLLGAAACVHYVHGAGQGPAVPAPAAAPAPASTGIHFAADAPQWASIKVAVLASQPLPVSAPVNGRITYDEDRTARVSSPIAGRVTALRTEAGSVVRAGAVLATIDAPELATAQADLRKAQADERRKQQALQRAQTLFEAEVLARKDYEAALADQQQAAAETRRAAQLLGSLHASTRDEGNFGLRSPIDGVIARQQINPGQQVRPDLPDPLFVVTDLRHLWVVVDVPERLATAIGAGQKVSLETDAWPDERFSAVVEQVGLTLDPLTHRIQVRCAVANPDRKLKPEMFARVAFLADGNSRRAIAVPNTGLFVDGVNDYVFVQNAGGSFEKRQVTVALRGADNSFIERGLADGDKVVTEGALLLNAEIASNAR